MPLGSHRVGPRGETRSPVPSEWAVPQGKPMACSGRAALPQRECLSSLWARTDCTGGRWGDPRGVSQRPGACL